MARPTHAPIVKSPLGFFPQPFPGELLYSVVARYHHLAANHLAAQTRRSLFGNAGAHVSSDFPCHIDALAACSGIPSNTWLQHHTILDYFRPFIEPSRFQQASAMMQGGSSLTIVNLLGILANQINFALTHRYCPDCEQEDRQIYGVRYLRVEHHLPGVYACIRHRRLLVGYRRRRKTFELALPGEALAQPRHLPALLTVATWATDIWQTPSSYHAPADRVDRCRLALEVRGFITPAGHVRWATLLPQFTQHWKVLFTLPPFDQLQRLISRNIFPRTLLYNQRQQFHPIKHILLLAFLFDSWPEYVGHLKSPRLPVIEKPSFDSPNVTLDANRKLDVDILESLRKEKMSLRKTSAKFGCSVQRVKGIALRNGIQVDLRAKKIRHSLKRAIWRKLFMGEKTSDIAKALKLSQVTIEQQLSHYPGLAEQRRQIRKNKKRVDALRNNH